MGWPKKNEEFRLYYERKDKTYLLVNIENRSYQGDFEALGEILTYNNPENPNLALTGVSPVYLYQKCKRVSWSDLPEVWKTAFLERLNTEPEKIRGLWRTNELATIS